MMIGRQLLDRAKAYSLMEVLAIVAVISAVAVFLVQGMREMSAAKGKARRIKCVENLKSIGVAFRTWPRNSQDEFPFNRIDATASFTNKADAFQHFLALTNQLSSAAILRCPADPYRTALKTFQGLSNLNLSYFVNLFAAETFPQTILAGDRNLMLDGKELGEGMHLIPGNANLSWSEALHHFKGNVLMGDGSVQQVPRERLSVLIATSEAKTNLILIP